MKLTVHLFGKARDLAGASLLEIAWSPGLTVGQVRALLAPVLGDLLGHCAVAVNHEFASADRTLAEADEVAVIPPVSGG